MLPRQRREKIVEILTENAHCPVRELAERLKVSDMTIRRDLRQLEGTGKVIRTYGGAAQGERVSFEFGFLRKLQSRRRAKKNIAMEAVRLINSEKSIMLDSGTTTLSFAEELRSWAGVTVITTSLPIASCLQFSEGVQVLLLGGFLRPESPDLVGALTLANLESIRAEIAFVGADGIEEDGSVYNESLEIAEMLKRMVASCGRIYVLADSSKMGKRALMRFGCVADWEGLVTDMGIDSGFETTLRENGVNVIKAPENYAELPPEGRRMQDHADETQDN